MNAPSNRVVSTPVLLSAPSALGHLAVVTLGGKLIGVTFGYRSTGAATASLQRRLAQQRAGLNSHADDDELALDVLARLVRYADGEPVDFNDVPVAVDHLTPFGRRVIRACRAIGWGDRRTYGDLASTAGATGAARAVGQVMAGNRTPLVVPCHRVVAAGGRLGGFSAPDGLSMKRRLLDLETVDASAEKSAGASGLPAGGDNADRPLLAKTSAGA